MPFNRTALFTTTIVAAAAISVTAFHATAQPGAAPEQGQQAQGNPMEGLGERLVAGLNASEGCLGTDVGQMQSGKLIICAWFENAEAARVWYHSRTHRGAMNMFMRGQQPQGEPLEHVEDEDTPVMVVASITPATEEQIAAMRMPISQIAIELYAPLPGGASINGTFAPANMDVPHMNKIDMGPPPAQKVQ